MKNSISAGLILLTLLVPAACKKSSDTSSTKPSLGGLSITQAPAFVARHTKLTFSADVSDLAASDGTSPTVGLYWQVNTAKADTLTRDVCKSNDDFKYEVDTLGSYTVFCYAFAGSNYYNTSASSSFKAINPDTALTDTAPAEEITVKGKTWKARNMNHATMGRSWRNSPVLDPVMGRLFSWNEAQTVCPEGWHLPTVAEFEASFAGEDGTLSAGSLMADASFLKEKMWEYWPAVQITNQYGFNALPLGYIDTMDTVNTYQKYGEYAMWWTADQDEDLGTYLYIFDEYPQVRKGQGDKGSLLMGVRCVKN